MNLYSAKQVCDCCGIHYQTLLSWYKKGLLPEPSRAGRVRVWTEQDLQIVKEFALKRKELLKHYINALGQSADQAFKNDLFTLRGE